MWCKNGWGAGTALFFHRAGPERQPHHRYWDKWLDVHFNNYPCLAKQGLFGKQSRKRGAPKDGNLNSSTGFHSPLPHLSPRAPKFLALCSAPSALGALEEEEGCWSGSDRRPEVHNKRHVYLRFSIKSTSLGIVIIKINDEAPRWGKEMPHESLVLNSYLINNEKIPEKQIAHKKGLIVANWENFTSFRILTRNGHTGTWPGPAIGEVISGLSIVEKIIRDNLVTSGSAVS